jgi:hypothetical protein
MPWSQAQRERLAAEKSVYWIISSLAAVKWIDHTGDTKVDVELKTNNDNIFYALSLTRFQFSSHSSRVT